MPRLSADAAGKHPDEIVLLGLASGELEEGSVRAARRHVDAGCRLCVGRLSQLDGLAGGLREERALRRHQNGLDRDVPRSERIEGESLRAALEGAEVASALAERLLAAARHGEDRLREEARGLDGNGAGGLAFLYALQLGAPLAFESPAAALALAEVAREAAASLPDPSSRDVVRRQEVEAEALLLASQAELNLGRLREARELPRRARELVREAGGDPFRLALCDYFEGSAAAFLRDYGAGERLLKRAAQVFAEYGQDHFLARAEGTLGMLYAQKGEDRRGLELIEAALMKLEPARDTNAFSALLLDRASSLAHLRRYPEARTAYARTLAHARQYRLRTTVHRAQNGLAELAFLQGHYEGALRSFRRLVRAAEAAGYEEDLLFAELYAAECLGRLGRRQELAASIDALRVSRTGRFRPSPALEELFTCLDAGDLEADLVAHVRRHLELGAEGPDAAYEPYRRAG